MEADVSTRITRAAGILSAPRSAATTEAGAGVTPAAAGSALLTSAQPTTVSIAKQRGTRPGPAIGSAPFIIEHETQRAGTADRVQRDGDAVGSAADRYPVPACQRHRGRL